MDEERTLFATVGLPRSGKTTWARGIGVPIVQPDAIRYALHGERFRASIEPLVWGTAHLMVDSLFLAGHQAVILDATNIKRQWRAEWRTGRYATIFVPLGTEVEECLSRARAIDDQYIIPIIERQAREMEPLGNDEPWMLPHVAEDRILLPYTP